MRYDWNRYGNPGLARCLNAAVWCVTVVVAVTWPVVPWLVPGDPALAVIAPLWTLVAVLFRLQLRKAYGVREERRIIPPPPPLAELVAKEVERQRQARWDAITEQAFRTRPPDPAQLAEFKQRLSEAVQARPPVVLPPMRGQQARVPRPVPKPSPVADPTHDLHAAKAAVLPGPCAHTGAVPVDLALTGETVAWLCPRCDAQLPADWR